MADVLTHAYVVATSKNIDQRKEIAEHYREMQDLMSKIFRNVKKVHKILTFWGVEGKGQFEGLGEGGVLVYTDIISQHFVCT